MDFSQYLDNHLIIIRASVFKWENFDFNGCEAPKDKFFITLNCKINEFPVNAILPTSQYNKYYYSKKESLIDTVLLEPNESRFFHLKTIIDLKNIIQKEEDEIHSAFNSEFLIYLGELEDEIFKRIENTIRNSDLIDPFKISEYLCED